MGLILVLGMMAAAADTGSGKGASPPNLQIVVDPRVELMSVLFRLAGNPEYNQGKVPSYIEDVEKAFGGLRNHPAVQKAAELRRTRGVSYDACMSLAVHLTDVPGLQPRLPLQPWPEALDQRWTPAQASNFLALARQFVQESSFLEFFQRNRPLYEITETRMKALMDKEGHLDWFQQFFGERPQAKFTLALGLLNGGCCYGPRYSDAAGREELFSILGVWQTDAQGQPEFAANMLDTVVHEFCHSYANAIIDRRMPQLTAAAESLFEHVGEQMRAQAYGSSRTMLCESLVRACVVRYLYRYEGEEAGRRAILKEQERGFLWMDEMSALLAEYESRRQDYPKLDDFGPRLVTFFRDYAEAYARKEAEAEPKRPKVISMVPANGAKDVDPSLNTIQVVFDRPMKDGSWSMVGGGPRHPETIGRPCYDERRTTWTIPVKLKPDWEYEFRLNYGKFDSFRSEEGVPLKPVLVKFRTAKGSVAASN
jgi:hypothetical protein